MFVVLIFNDHVTPKLFVEEWTTQFRFGFWDVKLIIIAFLVFLDLFYLSEIVIKFVFLFIVVQDSSTISDLLWMDYDGEKDVYILDCR